MEGNDIWIRVQTHLCAVLHGFSRLEFWVEERVGQERLRWLTFVFFALIVAVCYHFHEPWRDETQSWLMARDMSVLQLFRNAAVEGHPIGWHLLIKPLTILELPFVSLRILNAALVLGAAAVLLWRGPFRLWQKGLMLATPPFIFCAVFARSYTLILFLLMLQAWFHQQRMAHPFRYGLALGALANTMVLCLPYAAVMGAWWLREAVVDRVSRRVWWALLLLFGLGFLAGVQIMPSPDKASLMLMERFGEAMKELSDLSVGEVRNCVEPIIIAIPLLICLRKCSVSIFLAATVSIFFALLINFFIYPMYYRHYFTVCAILFALVWIANGYNINVGSFYSRNNILVFVFTLFCIQLFQRTPLILSREIGSVSTNTAISLDYVKKYVGERTVAAHFMTHISPLLAYMPGVNFWDAASMKWSTYIIFDKNWMQYGEMPVSDAVDRILRFCPVARPMLILSERWETPSSRGYALVFVSDYRSLRYENVFIYMALEKMEPDMVALPAHFSFRRPWVGL